MKHQQLLLCAVMLVAAAIAGCETKNVTGGGTPTMKVVHNFQVIALNWNSVQLYWSAPGGIGNVGYRVRWRPFDEITEESDTGTIIVGDFQTTKQRYSATIDHLQPKMYLFTIQVMTDYHTTIDTVAENYGAPAQRITADMARLPEPLRLYESTSGQGNALVIDTLPTGASRIVPTIAPPGKLHLVLTTESDQIMHIDSFRLRAAYTMPTYYDEGLTDPTVWITRHGYGDRGLDGWYIPYNEFVDVNTNPLASNHPYKRFRKTGLSDNGLVMRIGDPNSTSYRFMRIVILFDENDRLLRGTAPNRYIEIEISLGYPGIPFA